MLIKVKRKLFSIPVRYEIKNEETNKTIYKVRRNFFTISDKINVRDIAGNKLMVIKKKLFTPISHYRVYDGKKQLLFTLNRKFSAKTNFDITGTADNIEIRGEVFGMEWKYLKNDIEIATIKKELINLTSVYHIDLKDETEADLVVASIVAVDRCFSRRDSNSFN